MARYTSFCSPEEQKPSEEKVLRHVIIKADVRDSSRLTRSLLERGMNPACYFSLNFYDPVNKLLIEVWGQQGLSRRRRHHFGNPGARRQPGLAVAARCGAGAEIIEIVRGYNQLLERAGLPAIELGVGISFQDSAPMYLMDGEQRIMISDALNESDRLSSCNKKVRKSMKAWRLRLTCTCFRRERCRRWKTSGRLHHELQLEWHPHQRGRIRQIEAGDFSAALARSICRGPGTARSFTLWSGLVPVGNDIFRKILVRGSRMPQIDAHNFSVQLWTERWFYEICSNPAIEAKL